MVILPADEKWRFGCRVEVKSSIFDFMKALKSSSVFLAIASLLFVPAGAQVTFFGVQKTQFYTQTADSTAPNTPDSFSVFAFATTSSATDADSFAVSDNGAFSLTNSPTDPTSFGGSAFYGTKAAMDADFTAGDINGYGFTVNGGNLDSETDSLPIGTDDYPAEVYLNGTSLSSALAINPASNFNLNLGYTGTGTSTATAVDIFDASGAQVLSISGNASQASYVLSSAFLSTLTAGETYSVQLTDFNTSNVGAFGFFTGAGTSDGFTQSTSFSLEIVPEPSTWALMLAGLGLLVLSRRTRQA
jgi:PEP-CTERM motif